MSSIGAKPINWSRAFNIVALFFALFLARLFVAAVIDNVFDVVKDVDGYGLAARNIVNGLGFTLGGEPSLWKPPLYPYFLAFVFALFGQGTGIALLAQAGLDAGTGLLILWIGHRHFGRGVGYLAAFLFCLYPLSAYYTLRLMPESLFTLGMTATIAAYIYAREARRPAWFVLVGILGALTALTKPVAIALILLLSAVELWRLRRNRAGTPRNLAAMVVAFALVLAPWTLRNQSLTGQFIPIATGSGYAFWLGTHWPSRGLEYEEISDDARMRALLDGRKAVLARVYGSVDNVPHVRERDGWMVWQPPSITYDEDRAFRRAALEQMRDNPGATVSLLFRKLTRFWFHIHQVQNQWAQFYVYVAQGSLLALAMFGTILALNRRNDILSILAPILYLMSIHTITYATLRYSIPVLPFLMLLVAFALAFLAERLCTRFGLDPPSWFGSYSAASRQYPHKSG